MVNTPSSQEFKGGDTVQMVKAAECLRGMGVDVEISCDAQPDGSGFDLAHVFNLRTIAQTRDQVYHLKRQGLKVALSPIYLDTSVPLWGNRIVRNIFGVERPEHDMAPLLNRFAARDLSVKQAKGPPIGPFTPNRLHPDYDDEQREILVHVDYLLPNSLLEMNALVKTLRVADKPFTVVPYGADPKVFLDPKPDAFVEKHGLREFVLQVGRIEVSKNQVMLCEALRSSGLQLVLIGHSLQTDYLAWCKRAGPKNLVVISHLAPEELASAYAAARVHALPSWIETCGLVTMEAALAGCSVVCSIAGNELEYYRDYPYYCDPANVESIGRAVMQAYENFEKDEARREGLRKLILEEYTWQRAAERNLEGYERMLARKG